jgi:membrane protein DedA with SNARE-associated domain
MEHIVQPALAFITAHSGWATAVIFITAFGESFIFLSPLFPGTSMLLAAGTLTSTGALPYLPVLAAAVVGLALGDAAAFWIGRRFGGSVSRLWPFTRNPDLLTKGTRFFARHGGKSVFIGRFFGPVRAIIPLAAGIMQMPADRFWIANIGSAIVWAPLLLFAGDVIGAIGERAMGRTEFLALVVGGVLLFGIASAILLILKLRRRR